MTTENDARYKLQLSLSLILYEISCISCQLNSNPRIIHFNINIYSGIHTFNVKHYQLLYSSIFLPNVCRRQYYFSIHDMRQSNEIDKVKVEFALPFARFELVFFSLSSRFPFRKTFFHGYITRHIHTAWHGIGVNSARNL